MSNFKIIKRGYSQLEVDSYIDKLKNDYETRISEQKDRIFYLKDQIDKLTNSTDNELMTSLLSAVERAKLIENSSKNIYELETKKLNLLYNKMENLLMDENIYNDRSVKQELLALIQDCRRSLQTNLEIQSRNIKENSSGDPVKRLLSKMIGFNKISAVVDDNVKTARAPQIATTKANKNIQNQKKNEDIKTSNVKRSEVASKSKLDSCEFDKFLTSGKTQNSKNFENIMFSESSSNSQNDFSPNETGFDLKEAVNPKEDLEEIMKAFDFYNKMYED